MPPLSDRELLARLISFDTTSRLGNREIAEWIRSYVDGTGVRVDEDVCDAQRVNLVLRRPASDNGRSGLTLSGHLDVVPAGEPQWTGDPFTLRQRDGTFIGRGSCDMKGFVSLALNLLMESDDLRSPLCLVLTCDEEVGSLGARHLADTWPADDPLPAATIVGEPTSLRVVGMHKGHLKLRIAVTGRAAHSGSPHLGVNAIEAATPVLSRLAGLRRELEAEPVDTACHFSQVPFAVLNVARVHGGDALNVIPEQCVLEVGVRLLPGQDPAAMIERIGAVAEVEPPATSVVTVLNDNPPLCTDPNAPVHRSLCACVGQTETIGVSFASDGGALQDLGLQPVLFGPGSIEVAHRPDEFVPIVEMDRCRDVLRQLIDEFCRGAA